MPLPTPTIAPLAVAYIRRHGPQTAKKLSHAIGYGICSVRKTLLNAVDLKHLAVVRREVTSRGGYLFHYGLVKRVWIPKISAGEFCGYRATGTRASDIKRLAP